MHLFLRAAGFSAFTTESAIRNLLQQHVIRSDNLMERLELEDETTLLEYRLPVNDSIGICAGVLDYGGGHTELQYYYPYYDTWEYRFEEICTVERHTCRETYAGVIDGYSMTLSMIFFINNPIAFRRIPDLTVETEFHGAAMTAFANSAMILLPVTPDDGLNSYDYGIYQSDQLLEAALGGDEEAIETLTISDMEMYQEISTRIETEDLYSVVEQSLMPCGIECDLYSIIGEIEEVQETRNAFTDEQLYLMKISCNNVEFHLCVRKNDVLGEPAKGRRIKCKLWMQGNVNAGV